VVEEETAMTIRRTGAIPCIVLLVSFTGAAPCHAQTATRDSVRAAPSDTAAARTDTVKTPETTSGIDSVVTYAASDSVIYAIGAKTMYLYGKGNIKHKEMGLKAERIDINWNTSILHATGVVDTADTNSLRGMPDLIDGNESYHGSSISYNFKSKKGKIDLGKTEIEKGLYYGEAIKKMDADVLFVEHGRFTTCDLPHPHYYFGSPEMKVIVKDKVVARPIVMYIADVPVFALPFGVFPSQRGRRSGLIAPAYGESARGRYLTHLGYYWAMSDYMDWNLRADGYTKGSYTFYSDFRYALRYNFGGSLSGSYGRYVSGERGDPGYADERVFNLHVGHNQEFNPTTRLVVDFSFMSGSYFQRTSYNLNDLLRQNIISNATLTKYWEGTPNSMTLNLHRDQNLQAQPGSVEVSEILPSFNFSRSQTFPFRSRKRGAASSTPTWYELIGYSYSGQFLNRRLVYKLTDGTDIDERRGIQHSVTFNASPKLGYFTVTPFFNYTERWYDKSIFKRVDRLTNQVITDDVKAIKAVRSYDVGISAGTKFYGVVRPGVFGITGIRHQVQPTLSYTYSPDFSNPYFGYYGYYRDTTGTVTKYSYYEKEVFGGPGAGKRQSVSLNVGNVFEMKMAPRDTSQKEEKYQLLNLNIGLAYNFAADSLRFSELSMSFRTSIGNFLSIGGGSTFNLYKWQDDPVNPYGGRRVNRFLLNEQGRLAQLTGFNVSIGTRLSGEKKKTTAGPIKTAADSLGEKPKSGYVSLYDQEAPDFSIPWNLDLTWSFAQNQSNPHITSRSSSLSASLGFNLTENWKFGASASYDLVNSVFAAPQVTIYRDLHCWEMSFSWVPTGQYRNYRLEIRLKDPQLQDVKVTKQSSLRDVYY
jgi:lipopolysaccharide assembly outer membrane protein LptD (OstA)